LELLGSSCIEIFMPEVRASGGRILRNSLAALARGEKGLNLVRMSVINRVIIVKRSRLSRKS
jgi:hypothetical protein